MIYLLVLFIGFALTAAALFYFFKSAELSKQLRLSTELWEQKEETYTSELHKLEKIRHIPDIIERARKSKEDVADRLAESQRRAEEIVRRAVAEAQEQSRRLREEGEKHLSEAQEASRIERVRAQAVLDEAREEAKELASIARKEAKEKKEKAEDVLNRATIYALEIRLKAEQRAQAIAGEAFEAKGMVKTYQATAQALQNRIEKYEGVYMVPPTHILDELAQEFGFSKAGEKLKLARERTKLMRRNGTAAVCGYPEGWKKEHALKFVLSTFDGKVDTILSRVKSGNQGKLTQEIKDAYALVNKDGEVYKNARIQEEYLDSRLDEIKWAAAVQKLKERTREEQRAVREQIREEERAKREIEKAIKQAAREEELVSKAIEQVRRQVEKASEADKAKLEAQLAELGAKLTEAEERGRKALSMAQQTKKGHVYVISNEGSFGESVYKIGLTRRLEPMESRVGCVKRSADAPNDYSACQPRAVRERISRVAPKTNAHAASSIASPRVRRRSA